MTDIVRISFVWNADFSVAGGVRALREVATGHHECSLCEIAYHRVRQTGPWKSYKRELATRFGADIREPCRNQLREREREAAAGVFPAVLVTTKDDVVSVLAGDAIDSCDGDFDTFRARLEEALTRFG